MARIGDFTRIFRTTDGPHYKTEDEKSDFFVVVVMETQGLRQEKGVAEPFTYHSSSSHTFGKVNICGLG